MSRKRSKHLPSATPLRLVVEAPADERTGQMVEMLQEHLRLVRDGNLVELIVGVGPAGLRGDDVPFSVPQERIAIKVEDVDAETADLRGKGVSVLEGPRPATSRDLRISLVQDLNGHVLELQEAQ